MKIKDKILWQLREKGDLTVKELVDILDVSKQGLHVALLQLLEADEVLKFGRTPKTIYRISPPKATVLFNEIVIDKEVETFLKENFLVITETGQMLDGIEGFEHWCRQRKLPVQKTLDEYILTKKKYSKYYETTEIIRGDEKIKNTKGYDEIFLDHILYLDFYAIERFGKTRLGTLLHYAKQGQNKFLMKILTQELRSKLQLLLSKNKFDAVGFVPPTIRREVQLMKYLETHLKINLPKIKIQKISGIIPIPQKSLSKIEERITNAENSFAINEKTMYKHILLIDDAVGSGSTLNQIAGKLKKKKIAKKVTGLAVVGSFKGFDVITDV